MKWEGLTQKYGKAWPLKREGLTPYPQNGKDSLEKWEGLIWKVRSTVSKNGKVWAKKGLCQNQNETTLFVYSPHRYFLKKLYFD